MNVSLGDQTKTWLYTCQWSMSPTSKLFQHGYLFEPGHWLLVILKWKGTFKYVLKDGGIQSQTVEFSMFDHVPSKLGNFPLTMCHEACVLYIPFLLYIITCNNIRWILLTKYTRSSETRVRSPAPSPAIYTRLVGSAWCL